MVEKIGKIVILVSNNTFLVKELYKNALAQSIKDTLKAELQRPLECNGKPRPILETIDKMTHNHHT